MKAIDLAPTQANAYLLLAQLYVTSGKQQSGLDRLNALVSKTNSAAAYMQIGVIYDTMKDYPKAREAYEETLRINPNFTPVLNNLSYLYCERLNDPDKAYPLAKKACDLAPHDPASADTLAWILFKKGDFAHARPMVEDERRQNGGQSRGATPPRHGSLHDGG